MYVAKTKTLPFKEGKYPGFKSERVETENFILMRDVAVDLRDGTKIFVDLYIPCSLEKDGAPALIGWSPYGKHGYKNLGMMPGAGVDPAWVSKYAIWEGPDPAYWCPRGYVIVSPDPRGAWSSEGELTLLSRQEGEDGYDVIQWLAAQPWSNGKVGMLGVSYLAMSQWQIAATQPPALAAICPWEGVSDLYREFVFHGGIPETAFHKWWKVMSRFSSLDAEDLLANQVAHPFLNEYWESKRAPLEQINVPALVVASWTDQGMHTRGTLEGFKRMGSQDKWLIIHGDKKWKHFYQPENVERQRAFFDQFLKGQRGLLDAWPKVQLDVRSRAGNVKPRSFDAWPLPGTQCLTLFLDAANGSLSETSSSIAGNVSYDSENSGRVIFDYKFLAPTDLIGNAKLKIWVEAESFSDADVFIGLQKIDKSGNVVGFYFFNYFETGPLALGWLRASHRELDAERSTLFQPWHSHERMLPLVAGEPSPLEIEIWPSGTHFEAGESLRLIVQGEDVFKANTGNVEVLHTTINSGRHIVRTGGKWDSHLLLPVVPNGVADDERSVNHQGS